MKRIGITLIASFTSLTTGLVTAHAAVQNQSQNIQVHQGQAMQSTQGSSVSETNSATLKANENQSQPQSGRTPLTNSHSASAQNTQTTLSTDYSGGISTQSQDMQYQNTQTQSPVNPTTTNSFITNASTTGTEHNRNNSNNASTTASTLNSNVSDSVKAAYQQALNLLNITTQTNTSNKRVMGYGVFDLQGHLLSDNCFKPGNAKSKFDDFAPNQPVVLIVRPIDSNGNPIRNTVESTVYLKSTNPSNKMTVDGHTFDALILKGGSYGIPFVYTNTGSTAGYDVIDQYMPHHRKTKNTTTNGNGNPNVTSSSQTSSTVATQSQSGSSSNGMAAGQVQNVSTSSTQSQDNTSQSQSSSNHQSQVVQTNGSSTMKQNQDTNVQTSSAEASSSTTDASGNLHVSLGQSQSVQSQSGSASQSESTAFGASGSATIHFYQHQQSSKGDALQNEGIDATASGGTSSGEGNLSVYLNGNLTGQYSGVSGTITASQSESTSTDGQSQNNQSSDTVIYEQNGKTVTVKVK